MKNSNSENKEIFGSRITRTKAKEYIQRYKDEHNTEGKTTVYVDFDMSDIDDLSTLFSSPNGFRIYLGKRDDGSLTCVVVGTNEVDGCIRECSANAQGIIGFDFGTLCPPACNKDCDPNSMAREIYTTKLP